MHTVTHSKVTRLHVKYFVVYNVERQIDLQLTSNKFSNNIVS